MRRQLPREFTSLAHYFRETRVRQEDFAARMGVSQGTVSKWVNGQSLPGGAKLLKLSREARVPLERLVTGRVLETDEGLGGSS